MVLEALKLDRKTPLSTGRIRCEHCCGLKTLACERCAGTGKRRRLWWRVACRECGGRGSAPCASCRADGTVLCPTCSGGAS